MRKKPELDSAGTEELCEVLRELTVWWENWMPEAAGAEGGYEMLEKARAVLQRAGKADTLKPITPLSSSCDGQRLP